MGLLINCNTELSRSLSVELGDELSFYPRVIVHAVDINPSEYSVATLQWFYNIISLSHHE